VNQRKLIWWSILVSALIATSYTARLASGKPPDDVLYRYSTAAGAVVQYTIILVFVLLIAGFSRDLLALRRPRSWPRSLGLAALVFIGLSFALLLLEQILHAGEEQGVVPSGWEPSHAGAYAANFVVIALIGPIVEELTYRGLGYSLLEQFGEAIAIAIVGVTFALSHGLIEGLPELTLFGCALAWLRMRTRSVYPGILVHAVFNGATLVVAVTL